VFALFAALAALVLVMLGVESISRQWLSRHPRYYVYPPGVRLRVHPDRKVFPRLPPTARFMVNREGERGDELPASTQGLYRILVAGGSQPEGYFLDQDASWPGVLQRRLASQERLARLGASTVHVGCLARSGVGSEALDVMFSRILPQYPRLHMIITLIGASDVVRWIEQDTPDVLPPVQVTDVFRCVPETAFGWTPRRLATTELLRRARRRWVRPIKVDAQAGRWVGRARAMRANARIVRTTLPDPRPMLDHFEHHFRRALMRAKAHADRVLVVRQPWFDKKYSPEEAAAMWHGGVGHAWREDVTTYYSFDVFVRLMRELDDRAAAVARSLDVEQLDLMPILERSLNTYYDAVHLTDSGALQVANAVTAAILREQLPQRQAIASELTDAAARVS
jgi:hypothetical protein